jgi:hypothetical protein
MAWHRSETDLEAVDETGVLIVEVSTPPFVGVFLEIPISAAKWATGRPPAMRSTRIIRPRSVRGEDIGGIALHIGQRISSLAAPGEVLVSRTVTDLVTGSGLPFEDRGDHELKGLPGAWRLLAVRDWQREKCLIHTSVDAVLRL